MSEDTSYNTTLNRAAPAGHSLEDLTSYYSIGMQRQYFNRIKVCSGKSSEGRWKRKIYRPAPLGRYLALKLSGEWKLGARPALL